LNGILNIFKPEGITSNGAINVIKRLTGEKKIGHIGTLDPLARGVLPLFLGKFTKLIPYCNQEVKTYKAIAILGATSTTLDREGEIQSVPIPESCTADTVKSTLDAFTGELEQIPPMYSAVKIGGKKLYQLARAGQEIERKPRKITIFHNRLLDYSPPEFFFEVKCSKGTYIRSLVDDMAVKLGTRAYLKDLVRIACGDSFTEKNALDLDKAKIMDKSDLQRKFIDPKYVLQDWHEVGIDSAKLQRFISQGRTIPVSLDQISSSIPEERISKAIARTQSGDLIASGTLEFSQDSGFKFCPEKVFI
jgi:tRNA pseudouridine55 synthase